VGDPAPDFTLFDTDGVQRSLSDYDDTVVVLFFVGWG
jgi:peroxiredoxin